MPNWCFNQLEIVGSNTQLLNALELLKEEGKKELTFNIAKPQPHNLYKDSISSDDVEKLNAAGIPNWYDWNIYNWGTKWDACNSYIDLQDEFLDITFETAWSPPIGWFYALVDRLKEKKIDVRVLLKYHEEGMGFCGSILMEEDYELYEYEGAIKLIQEDVGYYVSYDEKLGQYRNEKGQFVKYDSVINDFDYGIDL